MASKRQRGCSWLFRFQVGEERKSLSVKGIGQADAAVWLQHLGHLEACYGKSAPSKSTTNWLSSIPDRYREALELRGLIEPTERTKKKTQPKVCTLEAYCQAYIDSKRSVKESTAAKFRQVKAGLVKFFGPDRELPSITAADAEEWREWLAVEGNVREGKEREGQDGQKKRGRTDLSDNTVRRRTGIAKQMFARAVKAGTIAANPFDGLPCSVHANEARQHFVSHEIARLAIDAAPNAEWRAVIALVRYGGLRSPSEPMRLRWQDVDLTNRRLKIHASKTEHHKNGGVRYCPIFPELLPYLEDLADLAKQRGAKPTDYVIAESRGSEAYFRTGFVRILGKIGIQPWPKLFQNMRASRETELLGEYPIKDVCSWIGNSQAVAMKHYAMMRDSVFAQAAGLDSGSAPQSAPVERQNVATDGNTEESRGKPETARKPSKTKAESTSGDTRQLPAKWGIVGDAGLEPATPCL